MDILTEIKALREQAQRIEDKMDKRLDRLEDKVDNKFLEINREISSFKKFTFGIILSLVSGIEFIKSKLGM